MTWCGLLFCCSHALEWIGAQLYPVQTFSPRSCPIERGTIPLWSTLPQWSCIYYTHKINLYVPWHKSEAWCFAETSPLSLIFQFTHVFNFQSIQNWMALKRLPSKAKRLWCFTYPSISMLGTHTSFGYGHGTKHDKTCFGHLCLSKIIISSLNISQSKTSHNLDVQY